MNATNTINAATTESAQTKSIAKTNWQLKIAGLIFWFVAAIQFIMFISEEPFPEFTTFAMYHALPLCATLAYFGIRKEQKKISNQAKD